MARVLDTGGSLYSSLVAVCAVDDDGTTIKVWTPSTIYSVDNENLTLTGISVGSDTGAWGTESAVYPMIAASAVGNRIALNAAISWGDPQSYYAALTGYTPNGYNQLLISSADGTNWGFAIENGTSYQGILLSSLTYKGATAISGNTPCGVGMTWNGNASTWDTFFGARGATGAFDKAEQTSGTNNDVYQILNFLGTGGIYNRTVPGGTALVAAFNGKLNESQFQALHADPFGVLFESGGTSVAPLAMVNFARMHNG